MRAGRNRIRYASLTLGWAACLLLSAVLEEARPLLRIIVPLTFSGLAMAGVIGMSGSPRRLYASAGLGVAWLAGIWLAYSLEEPLVVAVAALFGVSFIVVVVTSILGDFFRAERITADILWGTIGVYLLIATGYALVFLALDIFSPDAIAGAGEVRSYIYFAFVTMTTLGYGDIVPVSGLARLLASFAAITGIMYTAIIIARMVALEIGAALRQRHE